MKDDRLSRRSLTLAATASLAGAGCLAFGIFLAVTRSTAAGEDVHVYTNADDEQPLVKVISLNDDDEDGGGKGGYLGVDVREDTKSDEGGAFVNHVVADSPAAKAGLKDGDTIVGFDSDVVRGPAKLTQKIHATKPGDKVTLEVRRDGHSQKLTVEMGARPAGFGYKMWWNGDSVDPMNEEQMKGLQEKLKVLGTIPPDLDKKIRTRIKAFGPNGPHILWNVEKPLLGVQMVDTTEDLRVAMGGRKDAGILVGKVIPGSAAEKAGVKVGDLILAIDGKDVTEPGELAEMIQEREGKTIDIDVIRDKRPVHLKANLPKAEEDDQPTGPQAWMFAAPVAAPEAPCPPPTPTAAFAPMAPVAPAAPMAAPTPPTPRAAPAPPAPPALPRAIATIVV